MPRNVRNFWIEVSADGYRQPVALGPRKKDGGFRLTVRQRDRGQVTCPLTLEGYAEPDGRLRLTAFADTGNPGSQRVLHHVTAR